MINTSPTIRIPGRSNNQIESNGQRFRSRTQSLTQPPRAQSLQEPSVLWDRQINRTISHHEGVLEISLDEQDSWSRRYCILKVGEFSYETMGVPSKSTQPLSSDGSNILENPQSLTSGSIPLEMASAVRTVRKHSNAFMLVLVDGSALTFRAPNEAGYKEWLFHFHSSIVAVADRIRLNRTQGRSPEDVSFRAWRGDLGGSASFINNQNGQNGPRTDPKGASSTGASPSSQSPSLPFQRMGTRDQSWQTHSSNSHLSSSASNSNTGWIPPPRSPLGRSRSSSVSVTSSSLGPQHFVDRQSPSTNILPLTQSSPQEGGALMRTQTIQPGNNTIASPSSGLAASLKLNGPVDAMDLPPRPGSSGSSQGPHSPPHYGSFPRNIMSRGSSQDGSIDGGLRNSNDKQQSHDGSSSKSSRRVSVEGGVFDLSLEEADFSQVTTMGAQTLMSKLRPLATPSPPPSDDSQPLFASPNSHNSSPSPFVAPSSRFIQPVSHTKKCCRWHSAVFCARGVRPKNEDTFYIGDDASEGTGYSSQLPTSAHQGRTRGSQTEDGSTQHATGGGSIPVMKGKWEARQSSKHPKTNVGYFGVYDGHCGIQSSNMLALELHTDVFKELGSLVNSDDDDSAAEQRAAAREAAICRAFLAHDARYLVEAKSNDWSAGSTAVVGLVVEGGKKVVIANLGDSGALIVRRSPSEAPSAWPSPTNMAERDREEDEEEEGIVSINITSVEQVVVSNNEVSSMTSFQSFELRQDAERSAWNQALEAEGQLEAILLSDDHKPNRPDEQRRIEAARGWVTMERELFMGQLQMMDLDDPFVASLADEVVQWVDISRVCQELAVSRAFGDPDFKGFGPTSHTAPPDMLFFPFPDDHPRTFCEDLVLATPEVREHTLEEGDDFLVLATDGLWDVLSPQGVCQAIRRFKVRYELDSSTDKNPEALCLNLAEELTRLALRLGSADNITVTVVAFDYSE